MLKKHGFLYKKLLKSFSGNGNRIKHLRNSIIPRCFSSLKTQYEEELRELEEQREEIKKAFAILFHEDIV